MYLGQWDVSLDPIKQTILTEAHILQSTIVHNFFRGGSSLSTVMATVVSNCTQTLSVSKKKAYSLAVLCLLFK